MTGRAAILTLEGLVRMGQTLHHEEMMAIAKLCKVGVGRIALLQLLYEASACCTSIVIDTPKGPIMARSMDWDLPILKKLTIQLRVLKGGLEIYTATTFVAFIGLLTAMKKGEYSVSCSMLNLSIFMFILYFRVFFVQIKISCF
jgi:hypothetical protein